jgi:hypothetical protein
VDFDQIVKLEGTVDDRRQRAGLYADFDRGCIDKRSLDWNQDTESARRSANSDAT